MTYWTWRQSNLPQIASEIKDSMRRAANGRSIFTPQYQVNYYNIRYHLRWLFFGSPGEEVERMKGSAEISWIVPIRVSCHFVNKRANDLACAHPPCHREYDNTTSYDGKKRRIASKSSSV